MNSIAMQHLNARTCFTSMLVIWIVLITGCASNQMERNFYDKAYDQAGSRFEEYSLRDQIKIYLYGMQVITPSTPVLSRPIAEQGQAAIPAILNELSTNPSEQNIKDLMVIFETMERLGSYDVRHDKALIQKLDDYVASMKNGIWRGYTKEKLNQIKKSHSEENSQN